MEFARGSRRTSRGAGAAVRAGSSSDAQRGASAGASDRGTVAQAYLRMGTPDAEVVDLADELCVGLVVVGSRGLGGP
jgi:hypothetical protein